MLWGRSARQQDAAVHGRRMEGPSLLRRRHARGRYHGCRRARPGQGVHNAIVEAQIHLHENREAMSEMLSKDGKGYLPFPKEVVKAAIMYYDIPYAPAASAIKHLKLGHRPHQLPGMAVSLGDGIGGCRPEKYGDYRRRGFPQAAQAGFRGERSCRVLEFIKKALEANPKWRNDRRRAEDGRSLHPRGSHRRMSGSAMPILNAAADRFTGLACRAQAATRGAVNFFAGLGHSGGDLVAGRLCSCRQSEQQSSRASGFCLRSSIPELWSLGKLQKAIVASGYRLGGGLLIAVAIGVPIGIVMGRSKRFRELSNSSFQFLRVVRPLSWMPDCRFNAAPGISR